MAALASAVVLALCFFHSSSLFPSVDGCEVDWLGELNPQFCQRAIRARLVECMEADFAMAFRTLEKQHLDRRVTRARKKGGAQARTLGKAGVEKNLLANSRKWHLKYGFQNS